MKYRYIAIEGNIGSGKTTLAHRLAAHYDALLVLEEFQNNPFLEKFYQEPERYAFPLELSFLADRYQQLKNILPQQDLFAKGIVSDYIFPKTKIFAKNNLNDSEFELFARIADILRVELSKPDLLIFLHCPIEKLQENIHKRGREFEQNIQNEYLEDLEKSYHTFIHSEQFDTLIVDVSSVDLRVDKYFHQLLQHLEKEEINGLEIFSFKE